MFKLFSKKEELQKIEVSDEDIVALADGMLIDVKTVSDEMFANELMGKSCAFTFEPKKVTLCSPCNGEIAMVFPTGHAFGLKANNGMELLVHIGIDTVSANGAGFKTLKKAGDVVCAGDPVVEVDFATLAKKYEMPVMVIVTDANGKDVQFEDPCAVVRGQKVNR
ncbi:MAG: PTS glucose transporter subunit IIA [Erysipelotrichaceae bacterium]|nr:PTS glucose transporter subunit IIA [Erysipelotrichaceae bacterium]